MTPFGTCESCKLMLGLQHKNAMQTRYLGQMPPVVASSNVMSNDR